MALFQKKPAVGDSSLLYTVGATKSLLIIGLGNPGPDYESTRHNIGFAALDDFAARNDFGGWLNKKTLKAQITYRNLGPNRVILAKPATFMNDSGQAAVAVQRFFKIYNPDTLVVYDELALPFGQIRSRVGGSDAGHNGVKSLIQHIGEDFGRLRLGIGPNNKTQASADYVLAKFTPPQRQHLPAILKEAGVIITEFSFNHLLPHETRSII